MGKNERRNSTQNMKKAGVTHPSKTVSAPNGKFIQYPGNPQQEMAGRKTLKARPAEENQRKSRKTIRKQKARHRLTTAVLVIILLAICLFISLKVLFIVRQVEVEGTARYDAVEITNYCAIPLEENIFKIDTKTLEEALPQEFTYVEKAVVSRKLPDKILITITDSVPTYYGETLDGEMYTYTIYSQNFKKLTAQAAPPQGLTGISANLEDETSRKTLLTMIDKLARPEYAGVTKISVSDMQEISLTYDNRVTIQLGTMLDMDYKLKMSFHVLTNELLETDRGTINSTQAGSAIFQPEK
ncbi:MAG: FtsQ-type POTRA domain-containing protein [Oscillospiraceae bacterium]|nr:FtsQ-type POTRA domain-containing protein [Oscillospiraceae bacterium]